MFSNRLISRKIRNANTRTVTTKKQWNVNVGSSLPQQTRVVIAGAGVVANSVAYHLVKRGWREVVIIEKGRIGKGTSHFGSGTLGLFKPISHRNLIKYSIGLYKELRDLGYDVGLKQCGSLNLAQTHDRMIALKRRIAYNTSTGLTCELMGPKQLKDLHPYLNVNDLKGGVWVPDDAVIDPRAISDALATLAEQGGAKYVENTSVGRVLTKNGGVYGVETDRGVVKCEYFVNCAGMWARELGLQCSPQVRIPSYPAEHFYAITGTLSQDINESLPILRDFDSHTYMREYKGGIMVGWFEKEAKPAFEKGRVPQEWSSHLKIDSEHIQPLWDTAVDRLPVLKSCPNPKIVNWPDNFTPDGRWILGEAPEVARYFVACGMNGNSLQGAGGIGKAVVDWIIDGEPKQDLLPFSVQRFLDVHNGRHYLKQRTREVVGRHYALLYPYQCEYKYARKLRCSPLYSVLETRGAVFGIKMAYERALYFDSTYQKGNPKPEMPQGTFFKPKFFEFMKEEYLACRESVGIIDMSSFSKIEIKSPGLEVVNYLQRLCSNDLNISVGAVVHTGMQNERGGYENDCMIARQSENSYFMVSPTSQQTRIYKWMSRNLPSPTTIDLNDVTSMYTVLNVVGPKAHQLLGELSKHDLKMPPFSYMKMNVGYASDVMVMSFTHTGKPGYCLFVPSEYALHVYYQLMTVGRDYGVRDVGILTQRFMRIENFIPFWAEELNSFTTPFEAGNAYSVRLDKQEDFMGKEALRKQKTSGVTKQLVLFHLCDIDPDVDVWPWGGEPIYRNGEFVGTVTSAGYGFSAEKLNCVGFIRRPLSSKSKVVTSDYVLSKDAVFEIDIAGHKWKATPYLRAPVTRGTKQQDRYRPAIRYTSDISH